MSHSYKDMSFTLKKNEKKKGMNTKFCFRFVLVKNPCKTLTTGLFTRRKGNPSKIDRV